MENTTYLDTHAVVWLFNNDLKRFPTRTLDLIGNSQLLISPMVILELEYLFEINRLNINANTLFDTLQEEIDLQTCPLDFLQVINSALEENWTRDPFDRIIVAQASLNKSMLVSACTNKPFFEKYHAIFMEYFLNFNSAPQKNHQFLRIA